MCERLKLTLADPDPPPWASQAEAALWWLAKGGFRVGPEWHRAHQICQAGEGDRGCDAAHGLAHWIEGDRFNSDYWYRRADMERSSADARKEWRALAERFAR